jgi:hypothetical protein
VLKQLLDPERAENLAYAWDGDRYALFEDEKSRNLALVFLLALQTQDDTFRFFGQYSEALETKYPTRSHLYRRPNFFQFQTGGGGVYLYCVSQQCLTVEGATRETFDAINHALSWPSAPAPAETVSPSVAQISVRPDLSPR